MRIVAGTFGLGGKRRLPSESPMAEIRRRFEKYTGTAEVIGVGEETRMEFHPRCLAKSWMEQRHAAKITRAVPIYASPTPQPKAKRGLRDLVKWH